MLDANQWGLIATAIGAVAGAIAAFAAVQSARSAKASAAAAAQAIATSLGIERRALQVGCVEQMARAYKSCAALGLLVLDQRICVEAHALVLASEKTQKLDRLCVMNDKCREYAIELTEMRKTKEIDNLPVEKLVTNRNRASLILAHAESMTEEIKSWKISKFTVGD